MAGERRDSNWKEEGCAMQNFKRARSRRRLNPLMLIGVLITTLLVVGGAIFVFLSPHQDTRAADEDAPNPNCTLIVPANPLSAQGLATPYQLTATSGKQGACHEKNPAQSAFVQAAIIDPATGKVSIYDPLVVDKGRQPAADTTVPQLPQGAIVGIWFGYNGDQLTLKGQDNSLQNGNCVNGLNKSVFGQFAYCNAPAFFKAANQAIQSGKLVPPALGTGSDGKPCPTVRDFTVVDQDQSDNLTTIYLLTNNGKMAQATAANIAKLPNATIITNGSDNGLVAKAMDGALGCKPWTAPNLADPGQMEPSLPLNELLAAAHPTNPIALIPGGDPMVLVGDNESLEKTNLYRVGVNQPQINSLNEASTKTYCTNLLEVGAPRLKLDAPITRQQPTPDAAAANTLFTFLAQRFNNSWGADGLNCQKLLDQRSPIKVKTNGDDVAIAASFGNNNDDEDNNGNNKNNNDNQGGNNKNNDNDNNKHHKYGDNNNDKKGDNNNNDDDKQANNNDDNNNKDTGNNDQANNDDQKGNNDNQDNNQKQQDGNNDNGAKTTPTTTSNKK
jgi:hypothetical protein